MTALFCFYLSHLVSSLLVVSLVAYCPFLLVCRDFSPIGVVYNFQLFNLSVFVALVLLKKCLSVTLNFCCFRNSSSQKG